MVILMKTCNRIRSYKICNVFYFQFIKWHVESKFFTIKVIQPLSQRRPFTLNTNEYVTKNVGGFNWHIIANLFLIDLNNYVKCVFMKDLCILSLNVI
jgi:hypothetical protein